MATKVDINNIQALCYGASFLGSGGGGDTNKLKNIATQSIEKYGPISLISISELQDEDYIIAIELIGAPLPNTEQHSSIKYNFKAVFDSVIQNINKPIKAVMPVEIGGSNALAPMCIAGEIQLPVLDGDLLGRALPEIQMISTNIYNMKPDKAYIANPESGVTSILHCSSYEDLEKQARAFASNHKSTCAILIPTLLSGKQAKEVVIPNTISYAIDIGKQNSVSNICQLVDGIVQFTGTIKEWDYKIKGGFLLGSISVESDNTLYNIKVQNEYLSLSNQDKKLADVPDIITLLDFESLQPILSDQVQKQQKVICITCRGPKVWYSARGLELIQNLRK